MNLFDEEFVIDKIEANSVVQQLLLDMVIIPHPSTPAAFQYNKYHFSPFGIRECVSSRIVPNFPFEYFFRGMRCIIQQDQLFVIPK